MTTSIFSAINIMRKDLNISFLKGNSLAAEVLRKINKNKKVLVRNAKRYDSVIYSDKGSVIKRESIDTREYWKNKI